MLLCDMTRDLVTEMTELKSRELELEAELYQSREHANAASGQLDFLAWCGGGLLNIREELMVIFCHVGPMVLRRWNATRLALVD